MVGVVLPYLALVKALIVYILECGKVLSSSVGIWIQRIDEC